MFPSLTRQKVTPSPTHPPFPLGKVKLPTHLDAFEKCFTRSFQAKNNSNGKVYFKALKRFGKSCFHTHPLSHPRCQDLDCKFLASRNRNKAFPTETYSLRELEKLTSTHSPYAKTDPQKGPFPLHIQGKEETVKRTAQADETVKGQGLPEPSLFHRTGKENTSQH